MKNRGFTLVRSAKVNTLGFTLVEILVVMAIMAIIGIIMVAIFTNTLRGSNKSQILAVIKQNGQAVLENMDKTIRGADNVICPQQIGPLSDTLVFEKKGVYTRFRFIPPNDISKRCVNSTNANGCIQQDFPVVGSDIELFIETVCSTDLLPSVITLTDTNSQSGVSVMSGLFTRNKQPGFKDSVTVFFNLGPGVGIPTAVSSQIDPATFQTTVQLR
ncbi:MAG: prepilin-type N-terminal cleavage/methylation domain-containing protein [Candidatus Daviesbacteria bacterium]|nr:prepilin-type N-terminal cleavage/methylation domain-containing protein [Candidatus Daviesbacteria bacterium]